MVFALIAVRVHFNRSRTLFAPSMMTASIPRWNFDEDTDTSSPSMVNISHSVALQTESQTENRKDFDDTQVSDIEAGKVEENPSSRRTPRMVSTYPDL